MNKDRYILVIADKFALTQFPPLESNIKLKSAAFIAPDP